MKYIVAVLACVVAAGCATVNAAVFEPFRGNKPYRPYSTPAPFARTYAPVIPPIPVYNAVAPVRAVSRVATDDRNAETVRLDSEVNPDGSYSYAYETSNGIAAQEQGVPRNFGGNPPVVPVVAQGSYSWTSPEGQPIAISYIADENGYQPAGDSIPTPPPVPAQIARALEYVARYAPQKK